MPAFATRDRRWDIAVQNIHEQAEGVLVLHLIRDFGALTAQRRNLDIGLACATAAGDSYTVAVLTALKDTARRYRIQARRRDPQRCLCCEQPILNFTGTAAAVALPDVALPVRGLVVVICRRCATADDLRETAEISLRRLWPDLREIKGTHQLAGHA